LRFVVRTAPTGLLSAAALGASFWFISAALAAHSLGPDFVHSLWPASHRLLAGQPLYTAQEAHNLATGSAFHTGAAYVYPPAAALIFAPLSLLPAEAAMIFMIVGLIASALAVLWLLGVRQPICYAAMMLSAPFFAGMGNANLSIFLTLLVALAWRWRDKTVLVALALGTAVAMKLFVWPLLIWLLLRRKAAGVAAFGATAAISLVGWTIAGFDEWPRFFHALSLDERMGADMATTPYTLLHRLGIPSAGAHVATYAIGAAVLAAMVVATDRGQERRVFVLAIAATLVLSPIVWPHYFFLLLPALAIARPRLDWTWILFTSVFWFCPNPPTEPSALEVAIPLFAGAIILWHCASRRPLFGRGVARLAHVSDATKSVGSSPSQRTSSGSYCARDTLTG
jgi:alpha-1,2-mannosyltransferase